MSDALWDSLRQGEVWTEEQSEALVAVAESAERYLDALSAAAKARVAGTENENHQLAVNASDNVLALKLHELREASDA